MSAAGSDFEKVRLLLEEEKELTDKLDHLMERWAYLAEKIGRRIRHGELVSEVNLDPVFFCQSQLH